MRVVGELIAHIGEGPFMGGLSEPSMLDLAVFPQIVFGYIAGLEENLSAFLVPELKEWIIRVAEHLPDTPFLFMT